MAKLAKFELLSNHKPQNRCSLDTLAQLGTKSSRSAMSESKESSVDEPLRLIPCTHESDKKALKKRAKRKHLSTPLALRLVDASKLNPNSSLKKSYFNTYHCCRSLAIRDDGSVRGSYCKNRWCLVCCNIRTAQMINSYMPVLDEWKDKYFVTLTVPNCPASKLKETIALMQETFGMIHAKLKKQYQRKKRDRVMGLRKLECTYNVQRNDYHPHFHLIIKGKRNAEDILSEWLDRLPKTSYKAQDLRQADNKSAKELFKYFTKVVTTVKDKKGEVKDRKIYADAMDVIFNDIKGKRTFQNFGFKGIKVVSEDLDIEPEIERIIEEVEWNQDVGDWIRDSGELFSGHSPSPSMVELVTKKIVVRSLFYSGQIKLFDTTQIYLFNLFFNQKRHYPTLLKIWVMPTKLIVYAAK